MGKRSFWTNLWDEVTPWTSESERSWRTGQPVGYNWITDPNSPWNQLGNEKDWEALATKKKEALRGDLGRATEEAGRGAWGTAFGQGTQNTSLLGKDFTERVAGINRNYADQVAGIESGAMQGQMNARQQSAMMQFQAQLAKMNLDAQQRSALMQMFGNILGAGAQVATAAME